jgi:hypothetical protein
VAAAIQIALIEYNSLRNPPAPVVLPPAEEPPPPAAPPGTPVPA